MKKFLTLLATSVFFVAVQAKAANLQVWARAYHNSCSYHTNTSSDFDITIRDESLAWGTKVTLVSGLGGELADSTGFHPIHWDLRSEQPMTEVSANTWRIRRSVSLGERSAAKHFSAIEFVIKVEEPGRAARFLNSGGNWGYWRSRLDRNQIYCASGSNLPGFKQLPIENIKGEEPLEN